MLTLTAQHKTLVSTGTQRILKDWLKSVFTEMTLNLKLKFKNKQMNLLWLQSCLKPNVCNFDNVSINNSCRQAIIHRQRYEEDRKVGQHRQTRKKPETWELTNCFWSLWKSTTRDWFVWALALGWVKVDPDAMTGEAQQDKDGEKRKYGLGGKQRI